MSENPDGKPVDPPFDEPDSAPWDAIPPELAELAFDESDAVPWVAIAPASPDAAARALHRAKLDEAVAWTRSALRSAETTGRRTDCLREALRCLEGAIQNVVHEDKAAGAEAAGG
jgi:hypothetical protein